MPQGFVAMDRTEAPAGHVGSVSSALKILALLADAPRSLRLKDIAGPLSLNSSTCLNILRTLVAADVVHLDPPTKTYGPGLALATFARAALARDARLSVARPYIEEIASRHAVTVMLWRRAGPQEMVLLLRASGDNAWRVKMDVGSRSPLLHGSMGRVMATRAGLPSEELRRQFDTLSWDRALSFDAFLDQSASARESGWAVDAGYFHRSMASVSVPILEANGACEAALSAAMFAGQYDEAGQAGIAEALIRAADAIAGEPFGPS
jgi:DNA-binding IclR family transcriptional regulator